MLQRDELIIKPYDKYEVAFRTSLLRLLYIFNERNEIIKIDLKNKTFIRLATDKHTILLNPIPINIKNKNEKELTSIILDHISIKGDDCGDKEPVSFFMAIITKK